MARHRLCLLSAAASESLLLNEGTSAIRETRAFQDNISWSSLFGCHCKTQAICVFLQVSHIIPTVFAISVVSFVSFWLAPAVLACLVPG